MDIDLAETGSEGLRRALGESYDLVILDLLMPEPGGRTVLQQLLRDKPGQVVLVSGCECRRINSCTEALCGRVYIPVMVALAASDNVRVTKISSRLHRDSSVRGPAEMTGK